MDRVAIEKLEEVILLVAMLHENDQPGFDLVFDVLGKLKTSLSGERKDGRLIEAIDFLLSSRGTDGPTLYRYLTSFCEASQEYLKDPGTHAAFPNEASSKVESEAVGDIPPAIDAELLSDFIQEHRIKLEDFESALMTAVRDERSQDRQEITRFCKSYLHNIKGDSGTVGLDGIQQVTHFLEDLLCGEGVIDLIDILLQYKEWVLACTSAYEAGRVHSEDPEHFMFRVSRLFCEREGEALMMRSGGGEPGQVSDGYDLSGDIEILNEFTAEAEDHFQNVEGILLEKDEGFDSESVNAIFRAVHSIKGASSYFNLVEVAKASHLPENLLDKARKGTIVLEAELKGLVLRYVDIERSQLGTAKQCMLEGCQMHRSDEVGVFIAALEAFSAKLGCKDGTRPAEPTVQQKTQEGDRADPGQGNENEAPASRGEDQGKRDSTDKGLDVKTFVKVELNRLDSLIENIGEMVISSSMLIRSARAKLGHEQAIMNNAHQLEQICREIQEIGMSMRLVPIKGLLQKMSRLVWDTSRKMKKEINFRTEGEDTELDRTVIDRLADPLMHMVRNSMDHGIEAPADREKAGKPRMGQILIEAFHRGGNVHIKVSDDGKGMNSDVIFRKAVEKGIVSEGQKMSPEEIYSLIFAPGFSTAEKVTDISGRGVGMDVVRRNIESMRGRVSIESEAGKGSVFTIQLPLTLAIVDGIETCVGAERFIIPTHSIIEFVRPKESQLSTANSVETFQFRGRFVPVFYLSRLYGIETQAASSMDGILAVVESDSAIVAIVVDTVVGNYSTVIKPLGPAFEHVKGLAGGAIMSDGNIGLILDVPTFVQLARTCKQERSRWALGFSAAINNERSRFDIPEREAPTA